jgi:hypothetical protein
VRLHLSDGQLRRKQGKKSEGETHRSAHRATLRIERHSVNRSRHAIAEPKSRGI